MECRTYLCDAFRKLIYVKLLLVRIPGRPLINLHNHRLFGFVFRICLELFIIDEGVWVYADVRRDDEFQASKPYALRRQKMLRERLIGRTDVDHYLCARLRDFIQTVFDFFKRQLPFIHQPFFP